MFLSVLLKTFFQKAILVQRKWNFKYIDAEKWRQKSSNVKWKQRNLLSLSWIRKVSYENSLWNKRGTSCKSRHKREIPEIDIGDREKGREIQTLYYFNNKR